MNKDRFFALLHYARSMTNQSYAVRRWALTLFMYAYTIGFIDGKESKQ